MNSKPIATLFFFVMLFPVSSIASPTLTATCSPLVGTKVALVAGKAKTVADSKTPGPIFFVDSENPQKLVSLWRMELFGKETTEKSEATIIQLSKEKLQAIEHDWNGLYAYTIFFGTGTLLYSHHRLLSVADEGPTLLSFVSKCEIKVGQ